MSVERIRWATGERRREHRPRTAAYGSWRNGPGGGYGTSLLPGGQVEDPDRRGVRGQPFQGGRGGGDGPRTRSGGDRDPGPRRTRRRALRRAAGPLRAAARGGRADLRRPGRRPRP